MIDYAALRMYTCIQCNRKWRFDYPQDEPFICPSCRKTQMKDDRDMRVGQPKR